MKDLVKHIFNIGFPSPDMFLCVILLSMLQGNFVSLRDQDATVMSTASTAMPYTSDNLLKHLELKQQLIDGAVGSTNTVLLMQKGKSQPMQVICLNCHCSGHPQTTCWCEGGGMAGHRDEVLVNIKKCVTTASTIGSASRSNSSSGTHFDQGGCAFILDTDRCAIYLASGPAASDVTAVNVSALLAALPDEGMADFEVFLATAGDFAVTINWQSPSLPQVSTEPAEKYFILDTGRHHHPHLTLCGRFLSPCLNPSSLCLWCRGLCCDCHWHGHHPSSSQ